jgi:DNA-binding transcriptional LysR family regulator
MRACMNAHQLRAFVAVVEAASFTRAAEQLNIAQPTVTNRIKALERELDTTLFERLLTGVRITDAGRELLPYAREILSLTDRAVESVRTLGEPHGRVNVGSVECLTSYRLLPLIEYLYRRYPQVQVSIRSSDRGNAIKDVLDGHLDCAFFIDVRRADDDLNTKVLCSEPLALVVAPDHPLLRSESLTVQELQTTTLIRCDTHALYHARLEEALGRRTRRTRARVLDLDSIEATKRSVAHGMGMTLLPTVAVAQELADGRLCRLRWKSPFPTFTQVAWRRSPIQHSALATVVRTAAKVVREQVERPPV